LRIILYLQLVLVAVCYGQSRTLAQSLSDGERASKGEHWTSALSAFAQARAAAHASGDPRSESRAATGMAEAEFELFHDDTAEKLARESVRIAESINDQHLVGLALRTLGYVLFRRGGHSQELLSITQRKLAIETALGNRDRVAAELNNLGNLYHHVGDELHAIEYLSRSEKEFASLKNDRSRAVVLDNLGDVYCDVGDYERSVQFTREGLALSAKVHDDQHVATGLNIQAFTETQRGNYRESLHLYQKALNAERKAGNVWTIAEITNNIGMLYQAQQNHEQAIAHFRKTVEMNRQVQNKDLAGETHNNLGGEMLALARYEAAADEFRESVQLSHEGSRSSMEAQARLGLGCTLVCLNRPRDAETEFQKAMALQRAIPDLPSMAQTLVELSRLRLREGLPWQSLEQATDALELLVSIGRPEVLWQAHLAAGLALVRLDRAVLAATQFEASMRTIESLRTRIAGQPTALPAYFANKLEPYQERVSLAIADGQAGDALRFAEQSKSRALADVLHSGRVDLNKSLTPSEREAERKLLTNLASLDLQVSNALSDAKLKSARDSARMELEALQTILYAAHPGTAFERGAAPPLSASEITQLAASTGAVLLDYFVTPKNSYVFVAKRGAKPRVVTLNLTQPALAAKTAEFHRQLSGHDLGYAALALELYHILLAPVEDDLKSERSVVIVPDGPLWDVAFHALQPAPKHFLIEQLAVSYSPSLAVLRETMKLNRSLRTSVTARQLLAVGNPAGQPPIPESERQLEEIAKLYGAAQSHVMTGADASAARLMAESPNYRVLHLASHAILDSTNPMYSYAMLAKTAGDAGLLEARDLMRFDLHAELLVLSACETARGQAAGGEGINGMLWAAFVAGAPSTVASMWRVESSSTSDLMIGFHRAWLEARRTASPTGKAEALQKAALSLIATGRYAHPFYWAGFILVGSPQ